MDAKTEFEVNPVNVGPAREARGKRRRSGNISSRVVVPVAHLTTTCRLLEIMMKNIKSFPLAGPKRTITDGDMLNINNTNIL